MHNVRIGIDTGGTFTDFVIHERGHLHAHKVLSTPDKPWKAVLHGIQDYLSDEGQIFLVHGTTVATNALLERKGGKIVLITTRGFEDVLFIGRQVRKNLYGLWGEDRRPLLPRNRCFGLKERTSPTGKIEEPVHDQDLQVILKKIKKAKPDAVAVCLIHSYANPQNERRIHKALAFEDFLVCLSSDILPEYREYERTAATAVNAYLMPVISDYLENLEKKLSGVDLRIMQSNEGMISPERARREPLRTVLSGPAGGVVGAFRLGRAIGLNRIISFDMGGTSTDVSLIDGAIKRTSETMVGDFPVRLPMIDIHTVGAGGGSLAYVDRGGSLRVGPQSAGADPGPACYGKGDLPTVTDAHVVLGRMVPEFFLGGRMTIHPDRSHRALGRLARKIGKSLSEAASGVIDIANINMEKAIRVISVERGFDPREFTLVSFGGAGGMHAAEIAAHMRIPRVVIPKNAGVLSAFGLLMADAIKDYSCSLLKTADSLSEETLTARLEELAEMGLEDMKKEGFSQEDILVFPSLDVRYLGQSYEITLPLRSVRVRMPTAIAAFHRAHENLYGYRHPGRPVETVTIRIKAVGRTQKIQLRKHPLRKSRAESARMKTQPIAWRGQTLKGAVYRRDALEPGDRIKGPALVVDDESTTFLPPRNTLEVDALENLVIQVIPE